MFEKIEKFFLYKEDIILFKLSPPFNTPPTIGNEIFIFRSLKEIPKTIYQQLFPKVSCMQFRLWRKKAALVCFIRTDTLIAYGWVQNWESFGAFKAIEPNATMLGPFWTNPNFRGQGFYGKLIDYAITLCNQNYPAIIYAHHCNDSSLNGIRKKQFQEVGRATLIIFMKIFRSLKFSKK